MLEYTHSYHLIIFNIKIQKVQLEQEYQFQETASSQANEIELLSSEIQMMIDSHHKQIRVKDDENGKLSDVVEALKQRAECAAVELKTSKEDVNRLKSALGSYKDAAKMLIAAQAIVAVFMFHYSNIPH